MIKNSITLNMIANMLSFIVSLCISFFLTPYITKIVGIEAYGLIGLANSFIGYLTIVTSAINSMASRFIIIELHKNNKLKAKTFFSSVLIANAILAIIIAIPSVWLIKNISILKISSILINDARITFSMILINFIISLITARYGIVLYAKNILWKGSLRNVESNIIRISLIGIFFTIFQGKVYYVVLATLISCFYPFCFNYFYTKKYTPELKVDRHLFNIQAIKILVSAGIWDSITKLSQILLDGLDLLLSNLYIDGKMTGTAAIAKTIPSLYTTVLALISDSFYPSFLKYYSENKIAELLINLKMSIKVLSSISGICLAMLFVYAKEFYQLWLPGNDSELLRNLTCLATGTVLISGCVYSLFFVFSLTNNVRANSIALLITGILSVITTFICLRYTNLGIYAIVATSSIYGILRNLIFTPIYAAKCLKLSSRTFYPTIFRNLFIIILLVILDLLVKHFIYPKSWKMLFINGLINLFINSFIVICITLEKNERIEIFTRLKYIIIKKV